MKKKILGKSGSEPFFEKVEKLSKLHRFLICGGIFLLVIGLFVWVMYLPKFEKIEKSTKQYSDLKTKLSNAKKKARLLKQYTEDMEKAKADFQIAMKKLPEKKEIPSLLAAVSQSGQDSGLQFDMFTPKQEKRKDFYSEIPVAIKVTGAYHQIAQFFDRVSKLSRIVNLKNISITPQRGKGQVKLTTTCTAVTYKFVEPRKSRKKKK